MMKMKTLLSTALITFYSASTVAFDFIPLIESPITPGQPFTIFGTQAEDIDSLQIFKITNGSINGTDAAGNLYNLPDSTAAIFPDSATAPLVTLTVEDSNTQTIFLDGQFILLGTTPQGDPIVGSGNVQVGTITDYALRDTRNNQLVLGMRVVLDPQITVEGQLIANPYEINNLFRFGFEGFTAEAGWSRGSDADLRLFNASRTRARFNTTDPLTFDENVVRFQSDVNVSEGNPRSGFFFARTDAPFFTTQSNALSLFQAGEEGQPLNEIFFDGFVPTSTEPNPVNVPLPLWSIGLFAAVLGLFGILSSKKR